MTPLSNTTFDEIKLGQSATMSRTLSQMDIEVLAYASGDADAYHMEEGQTAREGSSTEAVAAQAFFGHLLNRRLPGPGTTIVAASFELRRRQPDRRHRGDFLGCDLPPANSPTAPSRATF